jgi:hypothetical protein
MHRYVRRLVNALALALVCTPAPALAFKIDTHVWVAMQVLDDLWDDCRLSLPPFADYEVDPGICAAVKGNPAYYLMGAVGPDGFPDLVAGQMTTHPGFLDLGDTVPDGVPGSDGFWRTDDWLRHVLASAGAEGAQTRPGAYAFAFGYLTHAASDVFSHTYVNTYAGDIFSLFDGEVEVEMRHMKLEDFIRLHTPPLVDPGGVTREPSEVIDLPATFVRDTLLLDGAAADQYRQTAATRHLAAMYDFWSKLNQIITKAEEIAAKAGRGSTRHRNGRSAGDSPRCRPGRSVSSP